MKTILLTAVLAGSTLWSFGQGTVNFANGAAGVDAPVHRADGTTFVVGPLFVAQLYGGANGTPVNSLSPMGTPVQFELPGPDSGYFFGAQTTVTNVPGGSIATLVVRVWSTVNGATYEAASTVNGAEVGTSLPINVTLATPPATPPSMVGLQSFNLSIVSIVPEPSAIILGGLGAIAVLLRRRKG